ncbi:MAG: Organic hydroperoxide resistance protein, partial [uncultured Solirubrobacteraceae bacterium]
GARRTDRGGPLERHAGQGRRHPARRLGGHHRPPHRLGLALGSRARDLESRGAPRRSPRVLLRDGPLPPADARRHPAGVARRQGEVLARGGGRVVHGQRDRPRGPRLRRRARRGRVRAGRPRGGRALPDLGGPARQRRGAAQRDAGL